MPSVNVGLPYVNSSPHCQRLPVFLIELDFSLKEFFKTKLPEYQIEQPLNYSQNVLRRSARGLWW